MSVYHKLRRFVQAHQRCGVVRSNLESATATGFLLWIDCRCGASFERWVAVQHEDGALLRSALLGATAHV